MTNKNILKGYFETGDIPNQSQYQELIDSNLNLAETGTQILVGTLSSSFLEVENHITSSGNISSSGNITANRFYGDTSDKYIAVDASGTNLGTNGGWKVGSHITASGNISASGTIIGNKIETDTLFSKTGDANTGLQFGSDTVFIEGNDVNIAKFNATRIELNSPITASGNISASGNIISNTLKVNGSQVDFTNLPTSDPGVVGRLYISSSFIKISV